MPTITLLVERNGLPITTLLLPIEETAPSQYRFSIPAEAIDQVGEYEIHGDCEYGVVNQTFTVVDS